MDHSIEAARPHQSRHSITVTGIQLVKIDFVWNGPAMTTVQCVNHADSVTRSQ
jgi:hypothetical protein